MNRGNSRNRLTTKQLFAVYFTLLVGRGLIVLPTLVTFRAHQDGWISILLAGLFSMFLMNVILFALRYFDGKTFIEISELAFGKYLGKLPGVILIVYYTIFTAMAVRMVVDLSDTWLLPQTPIEILTLSILVLCCYLCRNGMKVLGRFNEALIWILLPILILFFIPFTLHRDMLLFLPVGGSGLKNILSASFPSFYAFMGFESILLFYPYVRETASHRDIVRTCNQSMLVIIAFKVFVVAACIAVFGHIEIQYFLYPVLEYFKLLSFPIIERVEFVLIYFWLFFFFGSITGLYQLVTTEIEQVCRLQGYKNIPVFLIIPVYYLTRFPQNVSEVFQMINSFSLIGFFGISAVWILVLGIAFFRKRRRNQ